MDEPVRLLIATPNHGHTVAMFTHALASLCLHIGQEHGQWEELEYVSILLEHGSMLPQVRQNIVGIATQKKATHILWLDSDMGFPMDTFHRLYAHDRDLVITNATMRSEPFHPSAQHWDGTRCYTRKDSTGLESVGFGGLAVALTRTRVFDKMSEPLFAFGYNPTLHRTTGEDYSFFRAAYQLGYRCWVDHDLTKEIVHYGVNPYYYTDAKEKGDRDEEESREGDTLKGV
jgi:hypothetical protein